MNTQIPDRYISYFRYCAMVSRMLDSFSIRYDGKGTVLERCGIAWQKEGEPSVTPADFRHRETAWESLSGRWDSSLTLLLSEGPETMPEAQIRIVLSREGVTVEAGGGNGHQAVFSGLVRWGSDPEHSTFAVCTERAGFGLRAACGPAVSKWDDALLNREDGSLVRLSAGGRLRLGYSWEEGAYTFEAGSSFGLRIFLKYFEDRFQVPYRALSKKQYPAPPAGWMTWYAVKFDACEEAVLENIRLQKELLAPYGADTVWVDWEWQHSGFQDAMKQDVSFFFPDREKYPHGLEYIARKIKEAGFVPALWIAPTHEPVETEYIRRNPDAVSLEHVFWFGRYLFDITHPKFLRDYLPRAIRQVPQLGYEALKWDCLPHTLNYADRVHEYLWDPECSTYEAYRAVVRSARQILGDDFYMLSCSGANERTVLSACDIFDAARIGGDIFTWNEFKMQLIDRVLRLYPYHNTVIYCDPDNVVLRPEFNDLNQARTRITAVSLLGLPVTFGDDLRSLPMERLELLRRGLPTLDIHPAELREQNLEKEQLIINLLVSRPFDSWNIVGIVNLSEEDRQITVDFSEDLGLDQGEYLVYEYWDEFFYGAVSGALTVKVPAFGTAVLSVRKKKAHLQLVSTSRHITQGAAELLELSYSNGVLSGMSKVVAGELYTIRAFDPDTERLVTKKILPEVTGEIRWSIEA